MSTLVLMLQGGFIGFVVQAANPDWEFWEFFVIGGANAVLTVGYAITKQMEA